MIGKLFMQYGATPHYVLTVRKWLQERVPAMWIGRVGPHHWPTQSLPPSPSVTFFVGIGKINIQDEA